MAKIAIVAAIFVALVAVQGLPVQPMSISEAAGKGDWDLVHELIKQHFTDKSIWEQPQFAGSVRSLKPPPGGHVYGKSEYSFHQESNVNGQKNANSGGHGIINNDGKVHEYDFQPQPQQLAVAPF